LFQFLKEIRLTTVYILLSTSQILSREIRDTPIDIAPNHIHLLKYAPVTSCEVERSFFL
ncbi:hypothetical protein C0J52_25059, partial [Blattella germanica]